MSNKFLVEKLPAAASTLTNAYYSIVEHLSASYKVGMADLYKDALSNRLSVAVGRNDAKGPNILSLMFIDDNSNASLLTST